MNHSYTEPTQLEKQYIVAHHMDLSAELVATVRAEDIAFRRMCELSRQIREIEDQPWWKEMEDAR